MIRGQRKCINVQLVQNASIPWEIQQPPLSNSDTASNKNTRQSDSLLLPLDDIRVCPVRKGFFDVNGGVWFLNQHWARGPDLGTTVLARPLMPAISINTASADFGVGSIVLHFCVLDFLG